VVRADLAAEAADLLDPEWLAAQRWFGARDRSIAGVSLADAARLERVDGGNPAAWLLVAEVAFADGGQRRYLLPAVEHERGGLGEPGDGEGAWTALLAAIAAGATIRGERGAFRCEALPAIGALLPRGAVAGLTERRLGVEQSNTSVTIGDRLILKLYRRLDPGENPEIEVGTFLESVGCEVTPRMAGAVRFLDGEGTAAAAAMLQERVAATGDAWRHVGELLGGAEGGPEAAVAAAATIGTVTARLHAALAAHPLDPSFPVRPASGEELAAWRSGAVAQLDGALAALRGPDRERLAAVAASVRERMEAALQSAGATRVTRIHGDYHLGQLLRVTDGYMVIDFEGEPARPLAERRLPQPPERDVAGMLRSFDYAARSAERSGAPDLQAAGWLARAREAFLAAYTEAAPSAPDAGLLRAFELEKACYEVRYEAANRPDWTTLPLDALARQA